MDSSRAQCDYFQEFLEEGIGGSVHWTPMIDSIEKESFCLWGCSGIGAYVVSSAASKFLQSKAAGGAVGSGKSGGGPLANVRSSSASANARRRRTRSVHAGSLAYTRSLPDK